MDGAVKLELRVLRGQGQVAVECVEFGLRVNAASQRIAVRNLEAMLPSYCRTLLSLNGTSPATPQQRQTAQAVLQRGFQLCMLEPQATSSSH